MSYGTEADAYRRAAVSSTKLKGAKLLISRSSNRRGSNWSSTEDGPGARPHRAAVARAVTR
jgi:hypothetical protein